MRKNFFEYLLNFKVNCDEREINPSMLVADEYLINELVMLFP